MSIFLVVLFVLAAIAIPALWIWKGVAPLPKGDSRTILLAVIPTVSALAVLLLVLTSLIPSKSDKALRAGVGQIEIALNAIQPHITDSLLTMDIIDKVTSNTKLLEEYVEDNAEVGLIVRLVGLNSLVKSISALGSKIDFYKQEFTTLGEDFTLHNVFDYLLGKIAVTMVKITKVLQTIILVVQYLVYLILLVVFLTARKKALNAAVNNSQQ